MKLALVLVLACGRALAGPAADEPTRRDHAIALSATAQRTQAVADWNAAVDALTAYLAAFPDAPKAIELRFDRAQILIFHLQRAVEGADQMMIVARSQPVGAFHEPALLDAIEVYAKAGEDAKLDAAAELHGTLFAGGPNAVKILFQVAQRLYERQGYEAAIKRFDTIVTKYPSDPFAGAAADRLLEALAKLRDYERLEKAARKLVDLPAFKAREHQDRLARLIVEAIRAHASALMEQRAFGRAAEEYLRLTTQPKVDRVDAELFNAGVAFEQAGDVERAVAALRQVVDKVPKSPLAAQALVRAARLDADWRPDRSAEEFIRASALGCSPMDRDRTIATCRDAADARYNAALMFAAIGDTTKALATLATYAKDFPNGHDADDVAYLLGEIAERAGNHARAETAFTAYITDYRHKRLPAAGLALANLAIRLGHHDQALRGLYVARDLAVQQKDTARAAEAWFWIAELQARDAASIKLVGKDSQLYDLLRTRGGAMDLAKQVFATTVEKGDAYWAVAALDRSAHVDDDFAQALHAYGSSPVADSARDSAIAGYREVLHQADLRGVVGDYVLDARHQLERLVPEIYKPAGIVAREPIRAALPWPELLELHR